jgi:hypothetical protein
MQNTSFEKALMTKMWMNDIRMSKKGTLAMIIIDVLGGVK